MCPRQYNVTFALIEAYYKRIQTEGFHSLSYFDIGNWGTSVSLPASNRYAPSHQQVHE